MLSLRRFDQNLKVWPAIASGWFEFYEHSISPETAYKIVGESSRPREKADTAFYDRIYQFDM